MSRGGGGGGGGKVVTGRWAYVVHDTFGSALQTPTHWRTVPSQSRPIILPAVLYLFVTSDLFLFYLITVAHKDEEKTSILEKKKTTWRERKGNVQGEPKETKQIRACRVALLI